MRHFIIGLFALLCSPAFAQKSVELERAAHSGDIRALLRQHRAEVFAVRSGGAQRLGREARRFSFEPVDGGYAGYAGDMRIHLRPGGVELAAGPAARVEFAGRSPNSVLSAGNSGGRRYRFTVDAAGLPAWGGPAFDEVWERAIYEGIDVRYYGRGGLLEYDVIVAPGADLGRVRMMAAGGWRIGGDGRLLGNGGVWQSRPLAYQVASDGRRESVDVRFRINEDGTAGFETGAYDRGRTVVVDPLIVLSGYAGGTGVDEARALARDKSGNLILAGRSTSPDFKATAGAVSQERGDAFVQKVSPDGSKVLWTAFLGGSKLDVIEAVTVDSQGAIYVAGTTSSANLPTTDSAAQRFYGGGNSDGFVAKLSSDGATLIYCTYLGGQYSDMLKSISVDAAGVAAVTGYTASDAFPTADYQARAAFGSGPGAIVTRIDAAGSKFVSSTVLSGDGVVEGRAILQLADGTLVLAGAATAYDLPMAKSWQASHRGAGMWRSTDGGVVWSPRSNGMRGVPVEAMVIDPSNPLVLYAGTMRGVFKTTDGGANWSPANAGMSNSQVQSMAIDPKNPSTVFALTVGGSVLKSTNAAASWTSGGAGLGKYPWALAVDPADPSRMIATTGSVGVFRSWDGGENWTQSNKGLPFPYMIGIDFDVTVKPSATYVAGYGGVFRSTDSGMNWTPLNLPSDDIYYAVYVDPRDPQMLFTSSLYGGSYRSTSKGVSWSSVKGLSNVIVYQFLASPKETSVMYAATDDGVYRSTNGGESWAQFSEDLTGVTILALCADPQQRGVLHAGGDLLSDGFLMQLDRDGRSLLRSTYLGGERDEIIYAMGLDAAGGLTVAGTSESKDFPTTPGAPQRENAGDYDAFVARFNAADWTLAFSTFLGGTRVDSARYLVAGDGFATVAGLTASADFPVTGGQSADLPGGASDLIVAKVGTIPPGYILTTRIGGSGIEMPGGMVVGSDGIWLAGTTDSIGLGGTLAGMNKGYGGGESDAFLARLTGLEASLALKPGKVTFEVELNGSEPVRRQFVEMSSSAGVLPVVLRVTPPGKWLSVKPDPDNAGKLILTADALGMEPGQYEAEVEVASPVLGAPLKLSVTLMVRLPSPPVLREVLHAAEWLGGGVSPGLPVILNGGGFGGAGTTTASAVDGVLPVRLGQVEVLVNGLPAPLERVAGGQIQALIPFGTAVGGLATVVVSRAGQKSAAIEVPVLETMPGLFTNDPSGAGAAKAQNEDRTGNGPENPAERGRPIVLQACGEGQTDPPGVDGRLATESLPKPLASMEVLIGGVPCEIYYGGAAAGKPAGYLELNLKVPEDAPAGSEVPVVLRIGGRESRQRVTVSLK
ncbi:MAG: SBBP repeat-containing protein [Candidatus Solibacter usitatus]|nr:SBBP repeat-containing protein [Candidatus Solibacter usitatus]